MAVTREGVVKGWKENIIERIVVIVFIQPELLLCGNNYSNSGKV